MAALALWRSQAQAGARRRAQVAAAMVLVAALAATTGAAVVQTRPRSSTLAARRLAVVNNPSAELLCQRRESSMGYTLFTVRLRDASTLSFVVGNAVDFPNWPPGISPADVVDVQPHGGREAFRNRAPGPYESSAQYAWCLYDA